MKGLPREKVQLATKFGVKPLEGGGTEVCGDPEYVREACESSLKRLGVEYIDLYYVHRIDTRVPIEITVRFSISSMFINLLWNYWVQLLTHKSNMFLNSRMQIITEVLYKFPVCP